MGAFIAIGVGEGVEVVNVCSSSVADSTSLDSDLPELELMETKPIISTNIKVNIPKNIPVMIFELGI